MFFRKRHRAKEIQGEQGPLYFQVLAAKYNRSREVEPPRFNVWIPLQAKGYLWIGKETGYDRICKYLGLTSEVEIGVEAFDDNYFIATSHPRFVKTFLLNSNHRGHLEDLFLSGYDELLFDGERLQARYSEYRKSIPDAGNLQIRGAEAPLRAIGQNLAECFFGTSSLNSRMTKWLNQWGGRVGFSMMIFFLIVGSLLSAFITAIDRGALTYSAIGYLTIFLAALLIPLLLYLRSHPIRGAKLLKLILLPLPGLLMFSYGLLGFTNQILDSAPVAAYTLQVTGKHSKRNKDTTSYFIQAPSWHTDGETISIRVHEQDYRRVEPRDSTVELLVGSGYFGHEWLRGYRVL